MEALTICEAGLSRGSCRQGEGSPLCGSTTLPTDDICSAINATVQVATNKGTKGE